MEKKDPRHIGVPNINFSLTSINDDREVEFSKQRIECGFDDSETWSLRDTIANFTLPRLKRYREIIEDRIVNHNNFFEDVDKSIKAFELLVRDDGVMILTKEEEKEYNEGMEAYNKIFLGLWW